MTLLTRFWSLDLLVLIISLVGLLYLYMTRNFNYWKKRGVTQIPPIPFFGNFKEIILRQRTPGFMFHEWYVKYAPLPYVGFHVLDKPFLMIRDADLVKRILVKDANYFQDRVMTGNSKEKLLAANLFLIRNPAWKYLRSKLTSVYTASKLKKMFRLMIDVCKDLETFLEASHLEGQGKVLEMKDLSVKFTVDLIATTAYGIKANSLNNPEAEFRKKGCKIFEMSNYYEFLIFFAMCFAPQFVESLNLCAFHKDTRKFLRNAVWETLNERERTGDKRDDLIDFLIELRRNQPEEEKKILEFDGDNLVAQAAIFFTAGFESSSTIMSCFFYAIAVHPEIQDKLRQEIKEALKESDGKITYEMATSALPYLDAVVAETLRCYPPISYLERKASYDYKVPGSDLVIEKGTPVLIPTMGIHYDEEFYPDPMRFNPDNFSEENKKARRSGVYLPFGDGPHICMGLRLGLIQAKIGIITILSKYEVSPCKETPIPLKFNPKSVITTPDGGLYLNIRKIST